VNDSGGLRGKAFPRQRPASNFLFTGREIVFEGQLFVSVLMIFGKMSTAPTSASHSVQQDRIAFSQRLKFWEEKIRLLKTRQKMAKQAASIFSLIWATCFGNHLFF
jgi:hypothetical protein